MAKKSMIEREKKRIKLNNKYKIKRQNLLKQYQTTEDFNLKLEIHSKIQKLPRNSAKIRIRNRCEVSGRPRGYDRKLRMSRIALRDLASMGQVPGVVKSSW